MASAEGVTMTDIDGHKLLDAVGGLWNTNLGYSNQAIKEAITKQMDEMPYLSMFGNSSGPAIELAYQLAEWFAPDGLSRAFFTSGGSDSVETALRLARQYQRLRGYRDRTKFISLKKGYHGTHFGGASVNGNQVFRKAYEPLLPGCRQIPAPYLYQNVFGVEDEDRLADLCAAALEDEILFQGPETVAAFIVEPVLGGGGVIPLPGDFMKQPREICSRHGVLLIADEVITAFGRTGYWTGSRLHGIQPDMMCTAKAITNGYFPFGATMISDAVAEVFETSPDADGIIGHGYTYSGHPVGAAAALATLRETERLNVAANAGQVGAYLKTALETLMSTCPRIGDIRGQGLMLAIELVRDRATKDPEIAPEMRRIYQELYDDGVLVRINANNIILSPPLILTMQQADQILGCLRSVLLSER